MRKLSKVLAALVILSICGAGSSAEIKIPQKSGAVSSSRVTDVSLRFSKHEGSSRIVFEAADELFIQNTTVTPEKNQIKVQFPANLNLKAQGNPDMATSLKGNLYILTLNTPFKIKVLKLSDPPRLSIDIMTAAKEEGQKPAVEGTGPDFAARIRVVLDPGHGGYDTGILSGDLREKDITYSLARIMEAALIKKNNTVYLTRKADQFLSITDRAIVANQKSPDVFISIHLSQTDTFVIYTSAAEPASPDSPDELYGLVFRQRRFSEKSRALAEGLGKVLKNEFKKDIIYRKMELPLLDSVGAASVMVELPGTIASDQGMRAKISESLLRGIAAYAGH